MKSHYVFFLLVSFFSLFVGCTNGREDIGARASCGTLYEGDLYKDIDQDLGTLVDITSVSQGNLVTVREVDSGNLVLVLLAAIADQDNARQAARAESFALSKPFNARFFRTDENCTADKDNLTQLFTGQIYFEDGTSLAEELLVRGLVTYDDEDFCGSELLQNCYQALSFESDS